MSIRTKFTITIIIYIIKKVIKKLIEETGGADNDEAKT